MSKTVKKACISLLIVAMALALAIGIFGMPHIAAKADDEPPATGAELVSTRLSGGPDWQNLGYGQNGYILFGNGATFLSDMYEDNDGKTEISATGGVGSGFTPSASCTLNDDAPISAWQLWATTYAANENTQMTYKPYGLEGAIYTDRTSSNNPVPTRNISSRVHGRGALADGTTASQMYNDISFWVTLPEASKVTLTLYLYDWSYSNKSDYAQYPMSVNVYSNLPSKLTQAKKFIDDNKTVTVENFYGTSLISTDIKVNQAYISFELDGSVSTTYQFVAFNKNKNDTVSVMPSFGGIFFDEELLTPGATFAAEDKTTGANWEGTYGKDGYVIYAAKYNSDTQKHEEKAYTKGIYLDNGEPYTGLVSYTNSLNTKYSGEWKTDKEMSNSIVSRYGTSYVLFQDFEGLNWGAGAIPYEERTLRVPGSTTEGTNTRIGIGAPTGVGVAAFTLSANAFKQYKYVDVTVYFANVFETTWKASSYESRIYSTYYAWCYNDTNLQTALGSLTPLATHTLSLNERVGAYVTYRITAPGDYSIYLMNDAEQSMRGTIDGVFFDLNGAKTMRTITYNLGAGETIPQDAITEYAEGEAATLPEASKAHHTFLGWFDAPTGGNRVEITETTEGDLSLYPRFEAITYTITYNLDGGTNSQDNPATYTEGVGVASFANPTKEGYTFDGWYADALFINKVTSVSASDTGNKTLYAKFTANGTTNPDPEQPTTPGGDNPGGGDNNNEGDNNNGDDNTDNAGNGTESGEKKGCGGCKSSVAATCAVAAISLLGGAAVLLVRRKKQD